MRSCGQRFATSPSQVNLREVVLAQRPDDLRPPDECLGAPLPGGPRRSGYRSPPSPPSAPARRSSAATGTPTAAASRARASAARARACWRRCSVRASSSSSLSSWVRDRSPSSQTVAISGQQRAPVGHQRFQQHRSPAARTPCRAAPGAASCAPPRSTRSAATAPTPSARAACCRARARSPGRRSRKSSDMP